MLYGIVPLQYITLGLFLYKITSTTQPAIDMARKKVVMGLLCGTFGINVGPELGHRTNRLEQVMAKAMLLTSLYLQFFIN